MAFLRDISRFKTLVTGRRFGKSRVGAGELFINAVNNRDSENWYVAPSYTMAKSIMWPMLKEIIPLSYIKKVHETELTITLHNNSRIKLKGADNADSLRGSSISFLVMDEVQDISEDAWRLVLRPACADQKARVIFTGTPKSFNWFYDLYHKADINPRWSSHMYTTLEGGWVDEEEINEARDDMSPAQFRQEFEASFEALGNMVYRYFDKKLHVQDFAMTSYQFHNKPILVGLDFNVSPMTAVLSIRTSPGDGIHEELFGDIKKDGLYIFKEFYLTNSDTYEMSEEIIKFLGKPEKVIVCPDASGAFRSANSKTTNIQILEHNGFRVKFDKKNPPVSDRVNQVNALMMSAGDDVRMKVHSDCKHLIKALSGQEYDKRGEPDKTAGLDHMPDALGYLINVQFPLNRQTSTIKIGGY